MTASDFASTILRSKATRDGLGIKRWRVEFDYHALSVFLRPASLADTAYLIRLDRLDGYHVETRLACDLDEALRAISLLTERPGVAS